jgi:hypothetical protein
MIATWTHESDNKPSHSKALSVRSNEANTPTFGAELKLDGSSMARRNVKKAVNVKGTPVDLPRHRSADHLMILYLLVPTAA